MLRTRACAGSAATCSASRAGSWGRSACTRLRAPRPSAPTPRAPICPSPRSCRSRTRSSCARTLLPLRPDASARARLRAPAACRSTPGTAGRSRRVRGPPTRPYAAGARRRRLRRARAPTSGLSPAATPSGEGGADARELNGAERGPTMRSRAGAVCASSARSESSRRRSAISLSIASSSLAAARPSAIANSPATTRTESTTTTITGNGSSTVGSRPPGRPTLAARAGWDLLARESVGVSATVPALVRGAHQRRNSPQRRDGGEHPLAEQGVAAHVLALRLAQRCDLGEDRVRYADLADVVEGPGVLEFQQGLAREPESYAHAQAQPPHLAGVGLEL